MWKLSVAAIAFLTVCLAAESRDDRTHTVFDLKRIIEAISSGTSKRVVEDLLQRLKLPYYYVVARSEFPYDSGPSMVEPIPKEAASALTGSGGGRPGKDDDFVYFVVLFDIDEKAVASKAKVLGYW